jgi:methionine aminopeptidase
MKVLFVNNDGGGYADYVETESNMSIGEFVAHHLPGRTASDQMIRVNRQPVARDYVLQDGDRVTVTPLKIEGARAA